MDPGYDSSDDGKDIIPPKKMKSEWSKTYSDKAMEMMKKMGYENNKGLGKTGQGMLEPLTPSQHDGRRGLGLKSNKLDKTAEHWEIDTLMIPEEINWLTNESGDYTISFDDMLPWIQYGPKKYTIDDETQFCSAETLTQMLQSKTVFDNLNDSELRKARSRANPFETIRNSIFLNRAAVKMANIDSLCDFMFTNPRNVSGESSVDENDLLYFADICAGPGGFSEYILYRKSWKAKGFGFTLRGANDFTLDKFFAGPPESFDAFYGVHNDGNIFSEENQDSLAEYIFKHCPFGVNFVMADGGFSVEGQENIQEILSKQLYLCQCLTALKILQPNGHFVVKLFDIFTPFSVGLIYLMYKSFEAITIIKPNTSRPANSERYLVCKWKKEKSDEICYFLNHINNLLNKNNTDDVTEIVHIDILKSDQDFFNYIYESNNKLGQNQIIALKKVIAFCGNNQHKENRQAECRKKCLELWKLPDKLRQPPEVKSTESLLGNILGDWFKDKEIFSSKPTELKSVQSLQQQIESTYDWYFVPIGREETNLNVCSIFLCKSRGYLLRYTENKKWETVESFFEIPYPSLFYGEIVFEFLGEAKTQTRICSLHVIDGVMLGGHDIRRLKLSERMNMCSKFSKSISKPYREGGKALIVRGKPVYKLNEIYKFFRDMQHYTLKDNSVRLGLSVSAENKFFVPGGILILCEICHNYFSMMSKSRNMLYYFDKPQKQSYYIDNMPNMVKDILYASFRNSFVRRLVWKWTNIKQVEECVKEEDQHLLYRFDVEQFIINKTKH